MQNLSEGCCVAGGGDREDGTSTWEVQSCSPRQDLFRRDLCWSYLHCKCVNKFAPTMSASSSFMEVVFAVFPTYQRCTFYFFFFLFLTMYFLLICARASFNKRLSFSVSSISTLIYGLVEALLDWARPIKIGPQSPSISPKAH